MPRFNACPSQMKIHNLNVILNVLVDPIFLVNGNRKIQLANAAAELLFGENMTGRDFVYAIRHPDALESVEAVLSGEAVAEAVISLHAHARSTYRIKAVRFDGLDGIDAGVVVSLNDVTHILEAEQMRSDFVANVSHELRSPLTALSGGIETLKGTASNDAAARERFLDIMEREAARMDRLIGDLLSLSKVEVNEHVRPAGRVNVPALIERVTTALRTGAEGKRVRFQKPEGDWVVPGDEDELTQVFQNVIDNALKYSREKSEVEISITRRDRVTVIPGPVLAVAVKDKGEGVPAEHIPRLTERFYRVDDSRSREKGGTGLGLAIVKHILNRHRGRLLIESEKGKGSTFTVCLPLDQAPQ